MVIIMKIGIANDHGGVLLKNELIKYLKTQNIVVINYGTDTTTSVDFNDYADKLCLAINKHEVDMGIAICKTGIGMDIACNRHKGIRAVRAKSVEDAKISKQHQNCNVIVFGADYINSDFAIARLKAFLKTDFDGAERRLRRIGKLG